MTFKEYIDAVEINHSIYTIEEHCNGRYVGTHLSFGLNEHDATQNENDYVLRGADGLDMASIDSDQQIELKPNDASVYVEDRDGNKLSLTLFTASIIPHPVQ
jgi:hypothetical protein